MKYIRMLDSYMYVHDWHEILISIAALGQALSQHVTMCGQKPTDILSQVKQYLRPLHVPV